MTSVNAFVTLLEAFFLQTHTHTQRHESIAVITSRVIDSDSTKTHIQLRWLYLYYIQRPTGAKNTGYTGAKTGNPGATIMINTDPKH